MKRPARPRRYRRRVGLTIPPFLLDRAEADGLNLSEFVTEKLRERYRDNPVSQEIEKLDATIHDREHELIKLRSRRDELVAFEKREEKHEDQRAKFIGKLHEYLEHPRPIEAGPLRESEIISWVDARKVHFGLVDVPSAELLAEARNEKRGRSS
jgi:hypothetical protein